MADHCGRKILHHDYYIENGIAENTKFVKSVPNGINEKDLEMLELLGDSDWSVCEKLSLSSKQLLQLPEEFGIYINNLSELDLSNNKLMSVPYSLKFIQRLKCLWLDHNSIKTLPLAIVELSHLRVLQLSNNSIQNLPSNFGDIVSLETLILRCNILTELPESFLKLKSLKNLDLSENDFEYLPYWFGNLESLESLILRSNKLSDLPVSCSDLKCLEDLDLSRNRFNQFPSCLTRGMQNLEMLDVSHNKYMSLSVAPASSKLRELYMREIGNKTKFPLWLFTGCVPALEILDFDGTKFKSFSIPDNCPTLAIKSLSLQRCGIYDTLIQELTKPTDRLQSLRIGNGNFDLNGNAFSAIPIENLKNPELLTEIDMRNTGLFEINGAIKKCVNLMRLDIGNNNIYFLCNEICSLAKLKVLLIDENDLCVLPSNIGDMSALKELKANDNRLNSLPESIRDLKNLTYIDLYNNEFERIPMELEHMETLFGLDIDQNNFAMKEDNTIGGTSYENLKKAVRNHYRNRGCIRQEGPRYESDQCEDIDTSSNISSIEFHDSDTNIEKNTNIFEEEDWDNSADEFEPGRKVSPAYYGPNPWLKCPMPQLLTNFCPSDLHVQSVKCRPRPKETNELIDEFTAEGRFEDA